jgi:membrane-associated HD superfamily phosphohydrolase
MDLQPDRRLSTLAVVLLCVVASPWSLAEPRRPVPVPAPAPAPTLRTWAATPKDILATRDFSVPLFGSFLETAAHVNEIFSCPSCPKDPEAAVAESVKAFTEWAQTLRKESQGAKAWAARLYEIHKKVLGVELSRESFDRLRAAPVKDLIALFKAILVQGRARYIVRSRVPLRGEKIVVRVPAKEKGKTKTKTTTTTKEKAKEAKETKEAAPDEAAWEEQVVETSEVKDLDQAKKELERVAEKQKSKLPPEAKRDLLRIAATTVAPTLTLDEARSRKVKEGSVARVKRTPLRFLKGEVVVKKGTPLTPDHRRLIELMDSIRCTPCSGGPVACSSGLLGRLRPGSILLQTIQATRDFNLPTSPQRLEAQKRDAAQAVPRLYVCDDKVRKARAEKLGEALELAATAEGKERWKQLRDQIEDRLSANVLLQLVQKLDGAPFEKVHKAVLELYDRAQNEPLVSAQPPAADEACTLRIEGGAKPKEATSARCPVLPLARQRLEFPKRAEKLAGSLSALPQGVRDAAISLVQELLAPNTTFDAPATLALRKKAEGEVKSTPRFYTLGEPVGQKSTRLSYEGRFILEQMFSVSCASVGAGQ